MIHIDQPPADIAICFDKKAATEALVAVSSIVDHASRHRSYAIHAFAIGLSHKDRRRLLRLAQSNVTVILYDLAVAGEELRPAGWPSHISYVRLLLPRLMPLLEKVLYLDVDIVATTDIAPLFDTPLNGAMLGACVDLGFARRRLADRPISKAFPALRADRYLDDVLAIPDEFHGRYINAGVMLLDLNQLRSVGFIEKAATLLAEREPQLIWHDQCVVNALLHRHVTLLDERWNAMIPADFLGVRRDVIGRHMRAVVADASILHFTGGKPWRLHPRLRATAWWRYALASAGAEDILAATAQHFARNRPILGAIVNLCQIAAAWPGAMRLRRASSAKSSSESIASAIPPIGLCDEVAALYHASRDPRSPWIARLVAGLVAGYVVSPIDLIPDFVPVIGYMDDLGIIALGVFVLRRLIPHAVMQEHRQRRVPFDEPPHGHARRSYQILNWLFGASALAAWIFMRSTILR